MAGHDLIMSTSDVRVCQLTEAQLEAKHAAGNPEGTWCVGHRTGQLRVPAGERQALRITGVAAGPHHSKVARPVQPRAQRPRRQRR